MVRLSLKELIKSLEKCIKALEVRSTLDIYNSIIFRFNNGRLQLSSVGRYTLLTVDLDIEVNNNINCVYGVSRYNIETLIQVYKNSSGVVDIVLEDTALTLRYASSTYKLDVYGVDNINYLDNIDSEKLLHLSSKDYNSMLKYLVTLGNIYFLDKYIFSTDNVSVKVVKSLINLDTDYTWDNRYARLSTYFTTTGNVSLGINTDLSLLVFTTNNIRYISRLNKCDSILDLHSILDSLELVGKYKLMNSNELLNMSGSNLDNILNLYFKGTKLSIDSSNHKLDLDILNLLGTNNHIIIGNKNLSDVLAGYTGNEIYLTVYNSSKYSYVMLLVSESYGNIDSYIVGKVVNDSD